MSTRYRNVGGPHTRADGTVVHKGDMFEPTERELASGAADKFEPAGTSGPVQGADIGIRSLDWGSKVALAKALDESVTLEEMAQVEPSGEGGYITGDVNAVLALREA